MTHLEIQRRTSLRSRINSSLAPRRLAFLLSLTMTGDGEVKEPEALDLVQQEKKKLVAMKKDERGDFCKKFRSASRRRQEIRRLRCDAEAAAAKRIRNKKVMSSAPSSSPSSSSSSPQSSSTSRSAPSDSEGDGTEPGEVGVLEPAAAGDVPEGASAHISSPCVSHGSVSIVGRRREMEDAVTEISRIWETMTSAYAFFGVYDGHGGAQVAAACRERMHVVLADVVGGDWPEGGEARWKEVMRECFARVDEEVAAFAGGLGAEAAEKTVGSTAVVAVVGPTQIVVANCGDSRAVLSRGGVAVPLSSDHKPDRPDEMERVEAAGGRVINWGGYRVLGVLATSRSIGDYYLKPYVTSEPEVTVTNRTEKDEFLILASDGLWDVISNEVACRITRQCLSGRAARIFPQAISGSSAAEAAAFLAQLAMSRGSRDNISVIVVELKRSSRQTAEE